MATEGYLSGCLADIYPLFSFEPLTVSVDEADQHRFDTEGGLRHSYQRIEMNVRGRVEQIQAVERVLPKRFVRM